MAPGFKRPRREEDESGLGQARSTSSLCENAYQVKSNFLIPNKVSVQIAQLYFLTLHLMQ
jgi:hypothetical protein